MHQCATCNPTLVSVPAVSMPCANTATFAASALFTVPSVSRRSTMPFTTLEPGSAPPGIFTTRTLSTLKLLGFLRAGHAAVQPHANH